MENAQAGRQVRIPEAGVDLQIAPLLAAQELITAGSTGVTYREGAVDGKGLSADRPVICEGCVEMTGYAGSIGGFFKLSGNRLDPLIIFPGFIVLGNGTGAMGSVCTILNLAFFFKRRKN